MEAHYIGIDIGSTATKLAALSGERALLGTTVVPFGTGTQADQLALETFYRNSRLSPSDCVRTIATGYGRLIFRGADAQVSEISCHAKGLHHFLPQARTIIDVGGQDLKAIQINDRGSVQQFVMNDKCAAGTGRFLEVMSRVMGLEVAELGEYDARATGVETISNTCTVFAESEVISLIANNKEKADIANGICRSIAGKAWSLMKRVGMEPGFMMTGGVAKNPGVVKAVEDRIGAKLYICPEPEIVGAAGAALYALDRVTGKV